MVRTVSMTPLDREVIPVNAPEVREGAADRLAAAIRIETVSPEAYDETDLQPFKALHGYIDQAYPTLTAQLRKEAVGPCSLLYEWPGTDTSKKPVVLMSHLDVVPVEESSLDRWTRPPFAGVIEEGFIWGRGALDVKSCLFGILDAAETLLMAERQPSRTVYFAFGCDEERGGRRGARLIAEKLISDGVEAEFVLDEGSAVLEGIIPGVDKPVAMISVLEKGFVTLDIEVEGEGGHSSMPPDSTVIGVLAQALARIEENQMPARINEASRAMFETLAPEMPFPQKLVMANLWLFEPLFVGQLEREHTTNPIVRTTTAITIVDGGVQDNVLPKWATAKVNFRIAPGDTIEDVLQHIINVVNDERVTVTIEQGFASNPSQVSDIGADGFAVIRQAIWATFGDEVVVSPGMTVGGTDARHYEVVSENQYRFMPFRLRGEDTKRIHGIDERLSVEGYDEVVRFYMDLMLRL